jgi:hypothetical protein
MAKDPAILFYTQDFLVGTMMMSDEQVGKYIRLLCAQHQHGGVIPIAYFDRVVCGDVSVAEKFEKFENGYKNTRMSQEIEKRASFCSKQSENAKKRWDVVPTHMPDVCHGNATAMPTHMPNASSSSSSSSSSFPIAKKEKSVQSPLEMALDNFYAMRKTKKNPMTDHAKTLLIKKLSEMANDDATKIKILEQSILHGWQGVFELKDQPSTQPQIKLSPEAEARIAEAYRREEEQKRIEKEKEQGVNRENTAKLAMLTSNIGRL